MATHHHSDAHSSHGLDFLKGCSILLLLMLGAVGALFLAFKGGVKVPPHAQSSTAAVEVQANKPTDDRIQLFGEASGNGISGLEVHVKVIKDAN